MAAQDWYRKELENTLLAAETDKQTMLTIVQSIKSLSQQQPQSQSQQQVTIITLVLSSPIVDPSANPRNQNNHIHIHTHTHNSHQQQRKTKNHPPGHFLEDPNRVGGIIKLNPCLFPPFQITVPFSRLT